MKEEHAVIKGDVSDCNVLRWYGTSKLDSRTNGLELRDDDAIGAPRLETQTIFGFVMSPLPSCIANELLQMFNWSSIRDGFQNTHDDIFYGLLGECK